MIGLIAVTHTDQKQKMAQMHEAKHNTQLQKLIANIPNTAINIQLGNLTIQNLFSHISHTSLLDKGDGVRHLFKDTLLGFLEIEKNNQQCTGLMVFCDWNFSYSGKNISIIRAYNEVLKYYNAFIEAAIYLDISPSQLLQYDNIDQAYQTILSHPNLDNPSNFKENYSKAKAVLQKAEEEFLLFAKPYIDTLKKYNYTEITTNNLINLIENSANTLQAIRYLIKDANEDKLKFGEIELPIAFFDLVDESIIPYQIDLKRLAGISAATPTSNATSPQESKNSDSNNSTSPAKQFSPSSPNDTLNNNIFNYGIQKSETVQPVNNQVIVVPRIQINMATTGTGDGFQTNLAKLENAAKSESSDSLITMNFYDFTSIGGDVEDISLNLPNVVNKFEINDTQLIIHHTRKVSENSRKRAGSRTSDNSASNSAVSSPRNNTNNTPKNVTELPNIGALSRGSSLITRTKTQPLPNLNKIAMNPEDRASSFTNFGFDTSNENETSTPNVITANHSLEYENSIETISLNEPQGTTLKNPGVILLPEQKGFDVTPSNYKNVTRSTTPINTEYVHQQLQILVNDNTVETTEDTVTAIGDDHESFFANNTDEINDLAAQNLVDLDEAPQAPFPTPENTTEITPIVTPDSSVQNSYSATIAGTLRQMNADNDSKPVNLGRSPKLHTMYPGTIFTKSLSVPVVPESDESNINSPSPYKKGQG